jgi:hypothetical protein
MGEKFLVDRGRRGAEDGMRRVEFVLVYFLCDFLYLLW